MTTSFVPFVDLKAQYQAIKSEIDQAIQNVINDTAFIRGKYVKEFEEQYADKFGVNHCVSVANGTDAIYVLMRALGIGDGDEVITVANSWISTSETISQTGAKPVFVDIEPDYHNIDASKIEEKITPRTKAIMPVHLYGQPAEIAKIQEICNARNLLLIEDTAQSHLAEYNDKIVGTFGIGSTFSFYPGKNLGAYGDAGAIITNDDQLAQHARRFANHGAMSKHDHEIEGINSRLDGLQAAILSVKLKYLNEWNNRRNQNALYYNQLLAGIDGVVTPKIRDNCKHVFHLYVIRTGQREALMNFLKEKNIQTGIHYPRALPFLTAYKYLNHTPDDFPVAYKYQDEILSLPMYPELQKEQMEYVATAIKEFFRR